MSVVPHPPERPLLQGATPKASQHELKGPACLVGAMGKIAVVTCRDAEHAHQVADAAQGQGHWARAGPPHRQAGDVQQDEGQHPEPVGEPACLSLRRAGFDGRRQHREDGNSANDDPSDFG